MATVLNIKLQEPMKKVEEEYQGRFRKKNPQQAKYFYYNRHKSKVTNKN